MLTLKSCTMSSAFALAASFGAIPATALAQEAGAVQQADPLAAGKNTGVFSEIVVTAQRRAERSVDVPITVTTLGADQIATANVRDLADISRITPSLRFDTAAAFAQPTIRGIGTAVVTSGVGSNVGIYIDGFYSPNPLAANSQLMNVQSIQVLKGPQGTLFGRNTTGGAILIQSKEPSEDPGASFKISYGRFNQFVTQGYVTYGLAPGLAIDAEGMFRSGDGFQTNIVDGNDKIGKYESWSVRLGLKMDFSDRVSLLVRYMHGDIDDPTSMNANSYVDPVLGVGAPNFAPPSTYTTRPSLVAKDRAGIFTSNNDTLQATWKVDLGFADLSSYTQYRTEDVNLSQDLDAIGLPIFQIGIPVLNNTFSQDLLFSGKPGERLQWTAGLFYFSNKDRYQTYLDTGGAFRAPAGPTRLGGSSTTTKSYAAFVDATYELTPQLFFTAGARYAHDSVTDAYYSIRTTNIYVPSISSDKVTPRIVVRYKPSEESSIYASYSKGYKAAIVDVGGSCQNPPAFRCNVVKPEDVNAFEVGAKYDDRRLSIEAAAFYYDYKNLQVSSFLGDGRANITNAATSEIYGLEGSLRYELSRQFNVNAGASWTHARYKEFINAPVYQRCPTVAGCGSGTSFFIPAGTTLTNVPMQRTPEFTGNIGASYKTDLAGGEFQLSGNLYYTSSFNFGPAGIQFPQKGYEVATARAQWTDPSDMYTIAVWGDNLTNNRYLTAVQYNSFGLGANWSAPTTYGIELSAKF